MRSPPRRLLLTLAAALLPPLAACGHDDPVSSPAPGAARDLPAGSHLQYGTPTKLGEGMVRTYAILDETAGRALVELGVAIDDRTLEGTLPEGESMRMSLALPQQAPAPWDFVLFDWNPGGHPPPGVYTIPHFDFHFYRVPEPEVDAILPGAPDFVAKANDLPAGGEIPPFYFLPVAPPGTAADIAEPRMGVHWIDVRAPEIQRLLPFPVTEWAPFTKTFIYGSWAGDFTFVEPMITRDYLLQRTTETIPIPVPALYPESGWYPTAYRIYHDAVKRQYRIALTGFVRRTGG